ncbi:DUF4230 domain-containing protein [Stakelama marina]|uniref:DUF4230 domain-containing protein n=1 Tax=Stakelama marina TaxID=2826939 RepID=A0A8T4IC43_9SPHN|nr:DUF4230 domain-containing protein [Stakelama marina]MBR0552130.1 DUF4230 domain-containing protein [Stakelama marina]
MSETEPTPAAAPAPAAPRRFPGIGCFSAVGALIVLMLFVAAGFWAVTRYIDRTVDPDPVTIASASLTGLREQNKLTAFAARYVAVVTSKQSRLGLTAQKTIIMPGSVEYDVDLSKLKQGDVAWDADTKTLSVHLPPIELDGPHVELNAIREYGEGGILMSLTDAEAKLDAANKKAAQAELVRQARQPTPMRLAREATRRAIEHSFAMPLKAAGIDAHVRATFPGERSAAERQRWDVSKPISEVLRNRSGAPE